MKKLMVILLIPAIVAMFLLAGCGEDKADTAMEFFAAGQVEQAIEILNQEIKDNPRNAKAHYTRGMVALAKKERNATFTKHFNSAILLDEDYRDKIFELIFSYIDTCIEQQSPGDVDEITEMALSFAPDKREKAGEILFSKVAPHIKLNPIENRKMVKVIEYAMKHNPLLSHEAAELLHGCGKLLWTKGFKDQTSLTAIDRYFKKACDLDQSIKQDVSNTYLEMAKALMAESGSSEESLRFMTVAYDLDKEKGGAIARLCLEQAEAFIKIEEYGRAYSYTQTAVNFDSTSSDKAEQLRKKIPVIVEAFEDKTNCLFTPVEGRWDHHSGATGLAFGPSSMKNNVAFCSVPFSTGMLEYDFSITSARYADCDILLSYKDKRNFIRVSICPRNGDSKDRIEIVTDGKGHQLIQREPTVQLNTWNHIRIERTEDHITIFLNGQKHLQAQVPPPSIDNFAVRFWDRGLVDNFIISSESPSLGSNMFFGQ